MAKASRSNKKQPAFDPSELDDLIFSPAVGKGVGSHLVGPIPLTTVARSNASTAVDLATVVMSVATPVVNSTAMDMSDTSIDVASDLATVDRIEADVVVESVVLPGTKPYGVLSTVANSDLSTVDRTIPATVAKSHVSSTHDTSLPSFVRLPAEQKLWITENGDLVAEARVRRIRLAQDVINSAEENVYDTLWNAKLLQTDERDSCRIVQAGYDYLVKRTRLARKTIQRIVAKLLEKDFISIETRADIYQRSATVYRVYSYKAVLDKHIKKGRLYVAKMGPGFSYTRPLDQTSRDLNAHHDDVTTIDRSDMTTMDVGHLPTMAQGTTVTVAKIDRPTVVKMSPYLLDSSVLGKLTSSGAIQQELNQYAPADDDAVRQLIARCYEVAPDCTEDEIIHFIREKSALAERKRDTVYNLLGFLMTAVPRCFQPESLRSYRVEAARRQQGREVDDSREQAAMERWRREQEASLADPDLSEQEKHLIRLCLGLNTG